MCVDDVPMLSGKRGKAGKSSKKKRGSPSEWKEKNVYMLEVKGCKNRINLNQLIHICHLVPSCCFLFVMNVRRAGERDVKRG